MKNQYTTKDTLNSISWQLKRIADALETIVDQTQEEDKPLNDPETSKRIKDFLSNMRG
jgi:hypothetical protein